MGQKNRKQAREEKEAQQGKKVMITMGVVAVILVALMFMWLLQQNIRFQFFKPQLLI